MTLSVLTTSLLLLASAPPSLADEGPRYGRLQRRVLQELKPLLDPEGMEELDAEPLAVARIDLNRDGRPDYVAQLTNDDAYCLERGCLTFVLRGGRKLEVVGQFYGWTVRTARRKSVSGMRDLAVRTLHGRVRRYVFRGRKYVAAP